MISCRCKSCGCFLTPSEISDAIELCSFCEHQMDSYFEKLDSECSVEDLEVEKNA